MLSHHEAVLRVVYDIDRFFRHVFSPLVFEGPPIDPQAIQQHPHMIVCTHRSHVDYFLVGDTLVMKGFKNFRFAAGDNLTSLPYIGPRFRAFGAFTIEREIGFERNYVKNLCYQVVSMMEKREAVMVFPEGGRSYSGSTIDVKSGVLGAAVLLQARLPQEDVLLLPMAVSYEHPPDAPYFSMLLAGKRLRKRSQPFVKRLVGNAIYFGADVLAFLPFVVARRTGRRYGAVYIDFDEPVSVRKLVTLKTNVTPDSENDFFTYRTAMQQCALEMRRRFIRLYRLLPLHVVASLVKSSSVMTMSQAAGSVPLVLDALRGAGRNLKSLEGLTADAIAERGSEQLANVGALRVLEGTFVVKKPSLIEYFAAPLHDTVE